MAEITFSKDHWIEKKCISLQEKSAIFYENSMQN